MIARGKNKIWKQYRTPPEMKTATVKNNIRKVHAGKHLEKRRTIWSVWGYWPHFKVCPYASTKSDLIQMWVNKEENLKEE